MKSLFIATLSIILLNSCAKEKKSNLRVMTWNIWHGGLHGNEATSYKKDSINTVNVFKVINEADPDILFMQETYCCGMEMAKEAGFKYSWRGSSNLSIHSKYPIRDTINIYKPFNSHGVILDINNKMIMCVNVWLDWRPDYFKHFDKISIDSMVTGEKATRLKEIQAIIESVDNMGEENNMPIIIGGDFNSSSHLDWVESSKQMHFGKVVEWPVTKFMENRGYVDSFRNVNPDPPSSLEGTWGFLGNEGSLISDRIDYIFFKGSSLKAINSSIISEDPPNGFFNSDHRAILTEFEFTN